MHLSVAIEIPFGNKNASTSNSKSFLTHMLCALSWLLAGLHSGISWVSLRVEGRVNALLAFDGQLKREY